MPLSRPRQYGEFAASASSTGMCTRMRPSAAVAISGSGIATWTCSAKVGSRRASSRIESWIAW